MISWITVTTNISCVQITKSGCIRLRVMYLLIILLTFTNLLYSSRRLGGGRWLKQSNRNDILINEPSAVATDDDNNIHYSDDNRRSAASLLDPVDIWLGGDKSTSEHGLTRFISQEDQRRMNEMNHEIMTNIKNIVSKTFVKQGLLKVRPSVVRIWMQDCNVNMWEGLINLSNLTRNDSYQFHLVGGAVCRIESVVDGNQSSSSNLNQPCPAGRRVRRYLKSTQGCGESECSESQADALRDQFFEYLNSRNVSYVVLRWWDTLPSVGYKEDIDLLFDARDEGLFADLLTHHKPPRANSPTFDIYSDMGNTGSAYKGKIPYYQTEIAKRILDSRVLYRDRYFVPSKKAYLMSLMYHVVFHKGTKSGLPYGSSTIIPSRHKGEHDYEKILSDLAREQGMSLLVSPGHPNLDNSTVLTLDRLHQALQVEEWAPSIDMSRKLAEEARDPFLNSIYPAHDKRKITAAKTNGTVHAFVVREWSYENGLLPFILAMLDIIDLGVSHVIPIPKHRRLEVSKAIRGGKWDRGPYAMSGGIPAAVLVTWDPSPAIPKNPVSGQKYTVNSKVSKFKNAIREVINSLLIPALRHNPLHSSDDDLEAWEYIKAAVESPGQYRQIEKDIAEARHDWLELPPGAKSVAQTKSLSTRSKVTIIDWHESNSSQPQKAIYKVFRLSSARFLEREVYAYTTFSEEAPPGSIPKLLARGKNWIIFESFDYAESELGNLWRTDSARQQLANWLRWLTSASGTGWSHGDFKFRHAVVQRDGKIGIMDFELLQQFNPKFPFSANDTSPLSYAKHNDMSSGRYLSPEGVCWDYIKGAQGFTAYPQWKKGLGMSLTSLLKTYPPGGKAKAEPGPSQLRP